MVTKKDEKIIRELGDHKGNFEMQDKNTLDGRTQGDLDQDPSARHVWIF